MRTPSSQKRRLDLAHLWPTGSSRVSPSITARYFSAGPSDSTSRWTPCPPKYSKRWLQVGLGCIQLSPSCPFRRLHTFRFLRPARLRTPLSWIWRPSFERQRDFNPPEQRAAQRAFPVCRLLVQNPAHSVRFSLGSVFGVYEHSGCEATSSRSHP